MRYGAKPAGLPQVDSPLASSPELGSPNGPDVTPARPALFGVLSPPRMARSRKASATDSELPRVDQGPGSPPQVRIPNRTRRLALETNLSAKMESLQSPGLNGTTPVKHKLRKMISLDRNMPNPNTNKFGLGRRHNSARGSSESLSADLLNSPPSQKPQNKSPSEARLAAVLNATMANDEPLETLLDAMFDVAEKLKEEQTYKILFEFLSREQTILLLIRSVGSNEATPRDGVEDCRIRYPHHYVVRSLFERGPEVFPKSVIERPAVFEEIVSLLDNPDAHREAIRTICVLVRAAIAHQPQKVFDALNKRDPANLYRTFLQHVNNGPMLQMCSSVFAANVQGLIKLADCNLYSILETQFVAAAIVLCDAKTGSEDQEQALAKVENTVVLFMEFSRKIVFTGRASVSNKPPTNDDKYVKRLNASIETLDAIVHPSPCKVMFQTALDLAVVPNRCRSVPALVTHTARLVNSLWLAAFQSLEAEQAMVRQIAQQRDLRVYERVLQDLGPLLVEAFKALCRATTEDKIDCIGSHGEAILQCTILMTSIFRHASFETLRAYVDLDVVEIALHCLVDKPQCSLLHCKIIDFIEAATRSKAVQRLVEKGVPGKLLQMEKEADSAPLKAELGRAMATFATNEAVLLSSGAAFADRAKDKLMEATRLQTQSLFAEQLPNRERATSGEAAALFTEREISE